MKKIIVLAGILLSMTTMASERQAIVLATNLSCDGNFSILNPVKNVHFTVASDVFDSSVFTNLDLVGETGCTQERLEQIIENAVGSFGFVPGKVTVKQLPNDNIKVTVLLYVGPETIKFSGINNN